MLTRDDYLRIDVLTNEFLTRTAEMDIQYRNILPTEEAIEERRRKLEKMVQETHEKMQEQLPHLSDEDRRQAYLMMADIFESSSEH
jgi:hypothetical protein